MLKFEVRRNKRRKLVLGLIWTLKKTYKKQKAQLKWKQDPESSLTHCHKLKITAKSKL
jgi:hypothetical protein